MTSCDDHDDIMAAGNSSVVGKQQWLVHSHWYAGNCCIHLDGIKTVLYTDTALHTYISSSVDWCLSGWRENTE